MEYRDRNNHVWSIENGDWEGFQQPDDKLKESSVVKKKLVFFLFFIPLLFALSTFTISFLK